MNQQIFVLIMFLILSVAIFLVFQIVFLTTKKEAEVLPPAALNRYRVLFFAALGTTLGLLLFFTLPISPYVLFADEDPEKVISVVTKQFSFSLSDESPVKKWVPTEATSGVVLPAGGLVEFRVTSLDVNHGFGIYDPENNVVAQVQSMPGYVNRLRVRLERPGMYNIFCLEYCGLTHSIMRTSVEVK